MVGNPHLAFFAEDEDRLTDGWGYLVRSLGMVGRAYRIGPGYDTRIIEVASVAELPDLPIVLVTLDPSAVSLKEFTHPDECVYLFGSSNGRLTDDVLAGRTPVARVFIPSVDGTELFANTAGAVVMWDREVKGG
jgi:hypothetical protein